MACIKVIASSLSIWQKSVRIWAFPVSSCYLSHSHANSSHPTKAPARLTRLREKLTRLAELPVDIVLLLRFDQAFAAMSAEAFIQTVIIDGLKVRHLVVGDDFRFGRQRAGNVSLLQEAGRGAGFSVADTQSVLIGGFVSAARGFARP